MHEFSSAENLTYRIRIGVLIPVNSISCTGIFINPYETTILKNVIASTSDVFRTSQSIFELSVFYIYFDTAVKLAIYDSI